ncbi:MAG: hypothetical protein HY332_24555 [Chloroflexi bacterium]|nr:hypothetical protein [Chloroflexota bacterium]
MGLHVGRPAPAFRLPALAPNTGAPDGELALSDLRGQPVILVFLRWLG